MYEFFLEAGDCVFIPAWWWVQSETTGPNATMMVELEFEAHSQMYEIINQGIEMDIILGDENEEDSIYRLNKVEEKLKTDQ
jgi:hypothetical protein